MWSLKSRSFAMGVEEALNGRRLQELRALARPGEEHRVENFPSHFGTIA
jgi:hypothetical protein